MKDATLQNLITARALFEQAEKHCLSGDRYLATAGLIVLQDAFELVLYAVLVELGVDEEKKMESLDFDGMMGEVAKRGFKVAKSGTLKAMNKLRVTAKHYGQIMEPVTVQGHLTAALTATDGMLTQVIGKSLREIFLTEIVGDVAAKPFLDEAVLAIERNDFHTSLIATRKAFFVEFEESYCIDQFQDSEPGEGQLGFSAVVPRTGYKAPEITRNRYWIAEHVREPSDFLQIDSETWRLDAMEWGISTQLLSNIQGGTPQAIRLSTTNEWYIAYSPLFLDGIATRKLATQQLDSTIEAIRRKHEHFRAKKDIPIEQFHVTTSEYIGSPVYERPDINSRILHTIAPGDRNYIWKITSGFRSREKFYKISSRGPDRLDTGYIRVIDSASRASHMLSEFPNWFHFRT